VGGEGGKKRVHEYYRSSAYKSIHMSIHENSMMKPPKAVKKKGEDRRRVKKVI
jgi:hypothetical protein